MNLFREHVIFIPVSSLFIFFSDECELNEAEEEHKRISWPYGWVYQWTKECRTKVRGRKMREDEWLVQRWFHIRNGYHIYVVSRERSGSCVPGRISQNAFVENTVPPFLCYFKVHLSVHMFVIISFHFFSDNILQPSSSVRCLQCVFKQKLNISSSIAPQSLFNHSLAKVNSVFSSNVLLILFVKGRRRDLSRQNAAISLQLSMCHWLCRIIITMQKWRISTPLILTSHILISPSKCLHDWLDECALSP